MFLLPMFMFLSECQEPGCLLSYCLVVYVKLALALQNKSMKIHCQTTPLSHNEYENDFLKSKVTFSTPQRENLVVSWSLGACGARGACGAGGAFGIFALPLLTIHLLNGCVVKCLT